MLRERSIQARACPSRRVSHDELKLGRRGRKQAAQVVFGLGRRRGGGEPVVDRERTRVGDDIARDSPADADGVEALAVDEPVDLDRPRLVAREQGEGGCERVNRVLAHPGAGRVGAAACRAELDAQRAIAAALNDGVRGFAENREVGREQVGVRAREPAEAVELARNLFVVVPHPCHVVGGRVELHREREHDGAATLHVDGSAAVQRAGLVVALEAGRQVVVDGHGVDVARDHDALRAAQARAGDDRVTVAQHLEVRGVDAQGALDRVGEHPLIARDARHIAQRLRQRHNTLVHGQVGGGGLDHGSSVIGPR